MNQFALFKKSNEFYWSSAKIIYSVILLCCAILFIKLKILNLENKSFDNFLWFTILFTLLSGIILNFIGFTKIQPLRGNLDGYLSFKKEFIKVNDEIYYLENISNIKISNNDYIGKFVGTKGSFGPALSNGTNNFIIIFLKSSQTKRYQFELINSDDFQNIRTTLIEYYLKNKIEFWELANVLGEKSTEEIAELTKQAEEISTTANRVDGSARN